MDQAADPIWLTLAGRSGCGKTMLAREVFKWVQTYLRCYRASISGNHAVEVPADWPGTTIWQSRQLDFIEAQTFATTLRRQGYGILDDLVRSHFLVIDDMGAERDPSGFITEQWTQLLNRRLGKWTLITTNLYGDHLSESHDERIADRMTRDGNMLIESKATSFCA